MRESDLSPARSEKEIFFEALDKHTPEERSAFLDGACGTNPVQRARVESLLGNHFQQDSFMRAPALDALAVPLPECLAAEMTARMVGRYKLLEKIGEGGFGEVWMAEQCEPVRRRVALKILKLGMDSRQVVARFEAERQALAMMDHPNIARIFDGDITETGRPYFVMELVRGVKITDYCDQNQLPTPERLDLFIKVCRAIQHAHQKGIIHRDIKPTNVLVTLHDGEPVPKVIDFGIAKATQTELTGKTVFTQFQQFIGTPAYISPEQAELSGLDVDTRADIYSLGVLLYELLVGQTPVDAKEMMQGGLDALRRIIREREARPPSTKLHTLGSDALTTVAKRRRTDAAKLVHQLKGDLDWIVMKCLEKDRKRRYDTASGLAADIQRYLGNEPVVARPPGTAYKIRKAWLRNKRTFTAGAAVAIALLAGTAVSTWQAVEATRARKAEESQRIAAQKAEAQAGILQRKAEAERERAEAQLTRAEGLVYAGKIMLAQNDFEAGNGGLSLHYLRECQPALRGWEHRYLWRRVESRLTLTGHGGEVWCAAYSPDGSRIVTGSTDNTAKVWDSGTGRNLRTLTGLKGHILSVAYSPDGQRIVTGGGEWATGHIPGEVKVWDAGTGREILDLKGHSYAVWSVVFSPDGTRIATAAGTREVGGGEVKVWDAATGSELLTIPDYDECARCVSFSPDSRRLATGSQENTVRVWDAVTGSGLLTLNGHQLGMNSVAFNAAGDRIVTASQDGTAKVWDAGSGRDLCTLRGHSLEVRDAVFSPDGKRIVTGSADRTMKVWDAETGGERFTIKGHSDYVRSVAFSPEGQFVVSASSDGTAKVWEATAGQEVSMLIGHTDSVWSVAFHPASNRVVTGSQDGTARVWDVLTGQILRSFPDRSRVRSVAFSPDGHAIATGTDGWGMREPAEGGVKLWDAATGEELLTLKGLTAPVLCVAYSPDGRFLATATGKCKGQGGCEVKVWNAVTGKEMLTLQGITAGVSSVAFSPDGQSIAAAGDEGIVMVWEAGSGRPRHRIQAHGKSILSMAFSQDSQRLVTGSQDWEAAVWDTSTGGRMLDLRGHTGKVRSVAFSPDGQRILTGSDDRTAKLWDAGTGQEVLSLRDHAMEVFCVAFSPDGQRIATGIAGGGAVVKLWYAPAP